jgi:DHA2 family lincomycin resistance protein-like MFS transporter
MVDFGIILSAMYLLPQFIQNGLSLAAALTGMIMLPGGIINALTSALAGRIYDEYGAKKPAVLGFIIAFIGALASPSASIWYIILSQIILMIGCPLAMSPAQTYALNAIQGPASADGSTIMNTLQQIVGALATGQNISTGSSTVKFTNGSHYGFYFTLVLIVVGFLLSLTIKEDRD